MKHKNQLCFFSFRIKYDKMLRNGGIKYVSRICMEKI